VSEERKFKFLETRKLNQDALENTFGAIRLHCGSKNNQSVGQFVDALKTVIINGLAYRSLYGTEAVATQSIGYAMFAMHGKNSCLYGQCKGPHKTAYAMYAMLAM